MIVARPSDFQELTENINFRPLMFNKVGIDKIINYPNFDKFGVYVVTAKTRGITFPTITTVRYVLFDKTNNPLSIDSVAKTPLRNIDTKKLKEAGFAKKIDSNNEISNTSFILSKKDLENISADLLTNTPDSYCIFSIKYDSEDRNVPTQLSQIKKYKLFPQIIATWHGGGGGPGQGVGVSPAN